MYVCVWVRLRVCIACVSGFSDTGHNLTEGAARRSGLWFLSPAAEWFGRARVWQLGGALQHRAAEMQNAPRDLNGYKYKERHFGG